MIIEGRDRAGAKEKSPADFAAGLFLSDRHADQTE